MNLPPPTYSIYWDLPVLIVVVSLVYSATRFDDRQSILLEAFRWGRRMTVFLGGIAVFLFFLGWWLSSGSPLWVLALVVGLVVAALLAAVLFASKTS